MRDDLIAQAQALIEALQKQIAALEQAEAKVVKGEPERLAYSTDEAAIAAGVSRAHIYNEMARGNLRSVKLGCSRRILRSDLLAWLESNRT